VALTIAAAAVCLLTLACQPEDTRPGLWLSGEDAEQPVVDWRFTDDVEEIFIETRTWYGIRHSTTIWCAALDGHLYVGSYDDDVKFWEENVARDPEARLRIAGAIYDVSVTPVDSTERTQKLDERYAAKYDMADVFGDDLPAWRYYFVALRDAETSEDETGPPRD
jgi:hypothetical protein